MRAPLLLLVLVLCVLAAPPGHALPQRAGHCATRCTARRGAAPAHAPSPPGDAGVEKRPADSSGSRSISAERYRTRSIAIEGALKRVMELSSKYINVNQTLSPLLPTPLSLVYLPSEDSTLDLIRELLSSHCKWKSLPPVIQATLMQLITDTIFAPDHSLSEDIIDAVWCLGKLRFDYKYSSAQFKRGLNVAVSSRINGAGKGASKLLYGLSQLNFAWSGADRATQAALTAALAQQLPEMNELEVVNSVYALGKMGATLCVDSQPNPVLDPLFAAVERVAPSMGPVGLANCVWGFGKLNMRWREMPRSAQAALAAQFQAVGPRLGPQAVSSVLAGFAAMDTTWMLLQRSIRYSIETSIIKARVAEMNEQTVSMTLWGLAALKADRAVLQPQVFRPLFDGFVGTGAALKSQGLCSALYGLSVLGWEWGDLPQEVRVTFESYCANSRSGDLSEQSASTLIYSLGRMRAQWHGCTAEPGSALSRRACARLSTIAERNLCSMTEQGVCNTLLGLARMGASWRRLQPRLRYSASLSLHGVMATIESQGVSNALWSLAAMGVDWHEDLNAHHALSQALSSRLSALGNPLGAQALATSMHSLAKMGASYSALDEGIRAAFASSMIAEGASMSALEVSTVLYGLGRMSADMKSLPPGVQDAVLAMTERTCRGMNEQELGHTIWSLVGQMGVGYSGLPPLLQEGLRAAIAHSTLTKASVVAVLQGLAKARDTAWREVPPDVRQRVLLSVIAIAAAESEAASDSGDRALFSSITLLMFGKLGVDWASNDLCVDTPDPLAHPCARSCMLALFSAFVQQLRDGGEPLRSARPGRVVSNVFSGFALTASSWPTLDPRAQQLLCECVTSARVLAALNCNELATALWSLGRLGFVLPSLPEEQQQPLLLRLERTLPEMSAYEVTWTLWSLGQLLLPYNSAPASLRRALADALSRQINAMSRDDVGVVLWALERMRADLNDLPLSLREAVNARLFF